MARRVTTTTLSSREFNQNTSKAKRLAKRGPVFITDRGRPVHVLLRVEDYQALVGPAATIVDLLAMPGAEDLELEIPPARNLFCAANLGD